MYYCIFILICITMWVGWDIKQIISKNQPVFIIPDVLTTLFYILPVIYCGSLIHLLINEMTGKRVRIHSSKPVDIKMIARARIIYPLLHWIIFVLMYFLIGWIAYQSVQWIFYIYADPVRSIGHYETNFIRAIEISMVVLYLTFALRTLVEKGSRIIGITFLGFLVSWYFGIENSVPSKVSDSIQFMIDFTVHPEVAIILSLIFATLTYYSFTRRRSFLA